MEALRDALAAKDEFLQNASHEIRTPLHAIGSFADLAARRHQSQGEPDEKLARYLDNIRYATGRLSHFIEDILELVRLQSDHGVAHAETLDLRRSIETAAAGIESQMSSGHMRLETDITTEASEIRADPRMLEVLLRNLLSNAIKFSQAGGEIRISVCDTVVVSRDQGPVPGVLITVADEGVGIPEAELEHIFEKFQQSSRTRTGAGGTGLGLSICRAIVARHGGTITARNMPGGGAAFDVALPRNPTPAGTLETNGDLMPAVRGRT
jgi:signal transduction histidine kinase